MGFLGLLFLAAGAILTFAVADNVEGVDLTLVGYIMMGVGIIGIFAGLMQNSFGFTSRTKKHVTDDGHTVVEEHHTSSV